MAGKGWIKLHRKIMDNPIFNDFQLYRLWSICLLEATHKDREQPVGKQIVKLEPGQFVTGRYDLHELYNRGLKRKLLLLLLLLCCFPPPPPPSSPPMLLLLLLLLLQYTI